MYSSRFSFRSNLYFPTKAAIVFAVRSWCCTGSVEALSNSLSFISQNKVTRCYLLLTRALLPFIGWVIMCGELIVSTPSAKTCTSHWNTGNDDAATCTHWLNTFFMVEGAQLVVSHVGNQSPKKKLFTPMHTKQVVHTVSNEKTGAVSSLRYRSRMSHSSLN